MLCLLGFIRVQSCSYKGLFMFYASLCNIFKHTLWACVPNTKVYNSRFNLFLLFFHTNIIRFEVGLPTRICICKFIII